MARPVVGKHVNHQTKLMQSKFTKEVCRRRPLPMQPPSGSNTLLPLWDCIAQFAIRKNLTATAFGCNAPNGTGGAVAYRRRLAAPAC